MKSYTLMERERALDFTTRQLGQAVRTIARRMTGTQTRAAVPASHSANRQELRDIASLLPQMETLEITIQALKEAQEESPSS